MFIKFRGKIYLPFPRDYTFNINLSFLKEKLFLDSLYRLINDRVIMPPSQIKSPGTEPASALDEDAKGTFRIL